MSKTGKIIQTRSTEKTKKAVKSTLEKWIDKVKEYSKAWAESVINFLKTILNFFSRLFWRWNMFDMWNEWEPGEKIEWTRVKEWVHFSYEWKDYWFSNNMIEKKTINIPKGAGSEEKKLSPLKDIQWKKEIKAGDETFILENGRVWRATTLEEAKKDKTSEWKKLENGNVEFVYEWRTYQLDSKWMPIVPPVWSNLSGITTLQWNILVTVWKEKYVVHVKGGDVKWWKWFEHGKYIKNLSTALFDRERGNHIKNQSFEKPSNAVYSIETGDISHRVRQTFEILQVLEDAKQWGHKVYFPKQIFEHINALKEHGIIDNSIDMDTTTKVQENIDKIKDQIYTYIMSGKFFT